MAPNTRRPSAPPMKKPCLPGSTTSKTSSSNARQTRSPSPGNFDMSDLPSLTHSDTDSLPDNESIETEIDFDVHANELGQRAGRNPSLPLHQVATPGTFKLSDVNLTLKDLVESESRRSHPGPALDMWLRNNDNARMDRINLASGNIQVSRRSR